MSKVYQVPSPAKANAKLTEEQYQAIYRFSVEDPSGFWSEQARNRLHWQKPFTHVFESDLATGQVAWFKDGVINVSENCIDRHLKHRANQTAIIWESDDGESQHISYQQLHDEVCQLSNGLKRLGVQKGDRVCLYMPMIPETAYAMLACARIGAIHSVVFGGFSPDALRDRLIDAHAKVLITADEAIRGGKHTPLKANCLLAVQGLDSVQKVVTVAHSGRPVAMTDRDIWYHDLIKDQPKTCDPEPMSAEDPLFILYTSGSTGKPKGVLHSTAGYLLQASMTFDYVLDYRENEVYWCTADAGWITGHSYIVYGPLATGATTLMFAGVPNHPSPSRCWEICDKHQVSIFYTAPTAIRALMAKGDEPVNCTSRSSLRVLGTVGEPINPEAWEWYFRVVGGSRCPIVDTWWQTETGSIMLSPFPGVHNMKPGAAMKPFFGVQPVILDNQGRELEGVAQGFLAIKHSWPSQIRTVFKNHQRCLDTYYRQYPGYYLCGDGAMRDQDGDYWITGRIDDVLNVSGHRLGTAEIESAFVSHPSVAEAAVVGVPHEIKGQAIYAFVTLMNGIEMTEDLEQTLKRHINQSIGKIAQPEHIHWAPELPKTRSGKIMRRLLRKIATGDTESLGDISTLADPSVVQSLIENRREDIAH